MIKSDSLRIRKEIKSRKPVFLRQDVHKKKRLGKKWRRPKGLHNKLRIGFRGHRKKVKVGYKLPDELKHIVKGLKLVLVFNKKCLEKIDAKEQGILISGSLGTKKKVEILKEAVRQGITVLNIKHPEDYIKQIEEKLTKKRELRKNEKEAKKKVEVKKVEKKKEETKLSDDEKAKEEKKEKDKLLIKRT